VFDATQPDSRREKFLDRFKTFTVSFKSESFKQQL
jgi:hypothetical protein